MMKRPISASTRVQVSVFVIVGLSLLSIGKSLLESGKPESQSFAAQRQQLVALRNALPARGIVGYLDDGQDTPSDRQRYYLAQYELAPLVLEPNPDGPLVIGNFSRPVSASELPGNLILVHDFGNGLVLFAKIANPRTRRER
jgi:hypothetical protein